jgi:hypothetical protein
LQKHLGQKIFFFKKILYVIPSALLSFLPYYCHSFRSTIIPSGLLSFLPDYCHSFRISVIPSFYCHSFRIFQIFVIFNSSGNLPYPKGEKNGQQVFLKYCTQKPEYINKYRSKSKFLSTDSGSRVRVQVPEYGF